MTDTPVLDLSLEILNILLVGVGGQGTILASDVITEVGLRLGFDVKKAEIHGMSQRGGSVVSHVRLGKVVNSPIIIPGEVDLLIGFEKLEAVRYCHYLRPGGIAVINTTKIVPITVNAGISYPDDILIEETFKKVTHHIYWIDGENIAAGLGNRRAGNTVLLGAVSVLLNSEPQVWLETIVDKIPEKYAVLNKQAFLNGRSVVRP